jgi:hypothetical protein
MRPGHYVSSAQNRQAYLKQPIEADAREFADVATRQIQGEQRVVQGANKGIEAFAAKTAAGESSSNAVGSSVGNEGLRRFRDMANGVAPGSAGGSGQGSGNSQTSFLSQAR